MQDLIKGQQVKIIGTTCGNCRNFIGDLGIIAEAEPKYAYYTVDFPAQNIYGKCFFKESVESYTLPQLVADEKGEK